MVILTCDVITTVVWYRMKFWHSQWNANVFHLCEFKQCQLVHCHCLQPSIDQHDSQYTPHLSLRIFGIIHTGTKFRLLGYCSRMFLSRASSTACCKGAAQAREQVHSIVYGMGWITAESGFDSRHEYGLWWPPQGPDRIMATPSFLSDSYGGYLQV